MRYGWGIGLVLTMVVQMASAQRIIPALEFAAREYGVGGSYVKHKDAADQNVSNMDIVGHWGVRFDLFDLQIDCESGYSRQKMDVADSTAEQFRIAGNLLMNFDITERTTLFGLIGYGYSGAWTDKSVSVGGGQDPIVEKTKTSFKFTQYGGGLRYLLVPNVGLRLDYRIEKGVGIEEGEADRRRSVMLLGITVVQ